MVLVVLVVRRREHDGEDLFVVEAAGQTAEELRGGAACRLVGSDPVALDLDATAVGQDEGRDVDGVGERVLAGEVGVGGHAPAVVGAELDDRAHPAAQDRPGLLVDDLLQSDQPLREGAIHARRWLVAHGRAAPHRDAVGGFADDAVGHPRRAERPGRELHPRRAQRLLALGGRGRRAGRCRRNLGGERRERDAHPGIRDEHPISVASRADEDGRSTRRARRGARR